MGGKARPQGSKKFFLCRPNVKIIQLCASKRCSRSRGRAPGQGVTGAKVEPFKLLKV